MALCNKKHKHKPVHDGGCKKERKITQREKKEGEIPRGTPSMHSA